MKIRNLAVLLLSITACAHASIISEPLTGTLASGSHDYGYYFGGGDLGGDSVSLNLTYDTSATAFYSTSTFQEYSASSNGLIDLAFQLGTYSSNLNQSGDYVEISSATVDGVPGTSLSADVTSSDGHFVWLYLYSTDPFSANELGTQASMDTFVSDIYAPASQFLFGINGHADSLGFSTLTGAALSSQTAATPEPASWMLAAFGILAASLVRKRFCVRTSDLA